MAYKRKKRKTKKGLYPNGWPANMRAILYLNNKRRDRLINPTPTPENNFVFGSDNLVFGNDNLIFGGT